ncbi:MBL fold metallo-hydrolase [Microbulbifer yueqingensis]|uniref:beta-lactamase n=1 Tax=Microbulbifer yueqingensis TaxID=658219 RepID=A0A1G9DX11_9GAMM|nr:MBL fold metallo-hydrolase [Microbulbifer yueqingensis]SDK68396.1 Glyoxylase, beta-lactamase superfamily II [Microbulbifer yueqingensis]
MKIFISLIAMLVSVLGFAESDTKFRKVKLGEGAFFLTAIEENSTNIGVLKEGGKLILIDPAPGEDKLQELEQLIQDEYRVKDLYVLNTHGHGDHSGGNEYFLNRGAKLNKFNFESLKKYRVVSHSPNDLIFYHMKSNSIFVGDIFDANWHPTFYAGGVDGFVDAMDSILRIGGEGSLIVPGHGRPVGKSILEEYKKNTLSWLGRVDDLRKKNMTIDEMLLDKELRNILERFNFEKRSPFLPKKAERRFVERSIAILDRSGGT